MTFMGVVFNMRIWFIVIIHSLSFFNSPICCASTLSVKNGEDQTIDWLLPTGANYFFVYIGASNEPQLLCQISKGDVSYNNKLRDERFSNRLTVVVEDGYLKVKITKAKDSDEDTYTATAQYGLLDVKSLGKYKLDVTATSKSVSSDSGLSATDTGIIIGIVVAVVFIIVIIVVIRYCYDRAYLANEPVTQGEETMI